MLFGFPNKHIFWTKIGTYKLIGGILKIIVFYIYEIFNDITLNNIVKLYIKLCSLFQKNTYQQCGTVLEYSRNAQLQSGKFNYDITFRLK